MKPGRLHCCSARSHGDLLYLDHGAGRAVLLPPGHTWTSAKGPAGGSLGTGSRRRAHRPRAATARQMKCAIAAWECFYELLLGRCTHVTASRKRGHGSGQRICVLRPRRAPRLQVQRVEGSPALAKRHFMSEYAENGRHDLAEGRLLSACARVQTWLRPVEVKCVRHIRESALSMQWIAAPRGSVSA